MGRRQGHSELLASARNADLPGTVSAGYIESLLERASDEDHRRLESELARVHLMLAHPDDQPGA